MKNKYNIGDKVFYIEDNKVREDIVTAIHTRKNSPEKDICNYNLGTRRNSDGTLTITWRPEELLFPSKEELLASL